MRTEVSEAMLVRRGLAVSIAFLVLTFVAPSAMRSKPEFDYRMGHTSLSEDILKLRSSNPGRLLFFTDMRYDGVGSELLPMMTAASYAHYRGWVYAGAIVGPPEGNVLNDDSHGEDVPELAKFVFGRTVVYAHNQTDVLLSLPGVTTQVAAYTRQAAKYPASVLEIHRLSNITGPPWSTDILWLQSSSLREGYLMNRVQLPAGTPTKVKEGGILRHARDYYMQFDGLMRESFLQDLRERNAVLRNDAGILFEAGRPSIALHVRRGRDVAEGIDKVERARRYTPDEYYFDLVRKIRTVFPNADVHAFSSLEGTTTAASFQGYVDRGIKVHFEDTVGVRQAWTNMIVADIFIMAKSTFSYVPALLNSNCVVYNILHHDARKMERWTTVANFSESYIRGCSSTTR